MSTCKFFLQGTCKFGDSCKFSHQINDTSQTHGTSILRQQNSQSQQVDTNLLVQSVVNDMTNAEKGGHWLLSSYAPYKDKPCFPGFENRSFEEVRFGYYEAMKNGTVEQYKQQLHVLLQEAAMKMKMLQNPTNEIVSMLIQIYNTPVANQSIVTSPFGSSQTNPFFGKEQSSPFQKSPAQSGSIFALANQQLFGNNASQQQSIFGSAPTNTNSIFSGATSQPTNQSVFGGSNNLIFNKQPTFSNSSNTGGSIFANQNFAPNTQNTPFAASNNTQNTPFAASNNTQNTPFAATNNTLATSQSSIFNQPNVFSKPQTSPFQNQNSNNTLFNNPMASTNSSIAPSNSPITPSNSPFFTTNNISSSPFAQPSQQQQTIFANNAVAQQNISPFQQHTNTGNIFNNPSPPANIFASNSILNNPSASRESTASIFGQNSGQTVILNPGCSESIDSTAYSKLEDLTESELKSFQAESFEFGKIPEKPPTAQLCI